MSAVVDLVSDAVDFVGDAVGDVVEFVGDTVEDVVDIVKDAGDWLNDNVVQPLLDDPITTIATIAAIATGNPQLIPYINAASTAAKGGDLGDIALSFGASYAGNAAGQYAGKAVSQSLSTVAVDAAGNVIYQPAIDIAASTASGATRGAVTAGIQGGDIEQGALTGAASGFAGGVGKEAGQLTYEATDSKLAADIAAGVTRGATFAATTDKDIGVGAIMGGADMALNNAISFGSEYLFGEKKTQEDWEKTATALVGGQLKQAGMQEVYKEVADQPQRQQVAYNMTPQPSMYTQGDTTQQSPQAAAARQASDFELRRFVNDRGEAIYIQFRGGKPQQQIPYGFKEDKAGSSANARIQTASAGTQQPKTDLTLMGGMQQSTGMPSVGIQAPSSTMAQTTGDTTMKARKGGLATKKEKKPRTSKGLAAKPA